MTAAARYFCPLDCGWHHDQAAPDFTDPDRLYPIADIPAPAGVDQLAFQLAAGEAMALEAIIKAHLEAHTLTEWAQAVIRIKAERDRLAARLAEQDAERGALFLQLRDAEAQRDPLVVNEVTGSYLIGRQVASAGLYNAALQRAMKAEAERDGRREVERTQAEAAVERARDKAAEWAALGAGAEYSARATDTVLAEAGRELLRALDGPPDRSTAPLTMIRPSTGRYASQVNAPLHPATVAALSEHLASGDYPVRKVPRRYDYPIGDPLRTIDDHNYVGTPTFGQRCQDGPAGATCGRPFEQHVSREPCYHLDSKQLGARAGDLSLWCACGAQVFPGLRTTPDNPPASSDTANNPAVGYADTEDRNPDGTCPDWCPCHRLKEQL